MSLRLLFLLALAFLPAATAQQAGPALLRSEAEVIFDDFRYRTLDVCSYWNSQRSTTCVRPSPDDEGLYGPNVWPVRGPSGAVEMRRSGPVWYRFGWTNNALPPGSEIQLVAPTGAVDRQGFAVRTHALSDGAPPAPGYPDVISGFTRRTGAWAARVRLDELGLPDASGLKLIQAFWAVSPDGIRYEYGFDDADKAAVCPQDGPDGALCYEPAREGGRLHGTEFDHEWNNFFSALARQRGGAFDAVAVRHEDPDADRYLLGTGLSLRDPSALPAEGGWTVLTMRMLDTHARFDTFHEASGQTTSTGWVRLEYPTTRPVAAHFSHHFACVADPCTVDRGLDVEMLVDWFVYADHPGTPTGEILEAVAALRQDGRARYYQGARFDALTADAGNVFDGASGLGRQTPPVQPGTRLGGALRPPHVYRAVDPDVWAADAYNADDRTVRSTDYEVAWRWRAAGAQEWATPFERAGFNARPPAALRDSPVCAQVRVRDQASIRESVAAAAACSVDAFGCEDRPPPTSGPGRPYASGDAEVEWASPVVCERE